MTSWALEGDGPVESIYHLLWRKNVHLESCPKVRIPDTVIYKYRQPAYWYFTSSQDHQLKKKARNNHGNNKIMEGFTSKPSISDIVAYYISTHFVKSPVKGKKDKKVTTIEYFDAKGLQDFLYNRDKVDNGFLQAFVDPKGSSHSIIRATWSPQVFLLERRVNKISITDRKFDMYQRAATYEGTEDQSVLAPVTAKKLVADLQFICNSIVQHVMATSPHHVRISRMVCNFKLDAHEKIWFLWCSSLRIMDKFQSSRGVPCPLELDDQMVPAKQWNPAQIQGQVPPICKSKFFKCPNCTTTTGSDCKCQITYKLAILHYNPHRAFQLAQVAPTPESLALTQAAMLTANADSQQEAAAAGPGGDGEAKPDLYYPIQQTGGTTGTGTSSMQLPTLESPEQDDEDSGGSIVIPPIVAYHHRKLRASQFLKMIQEPAFLYNSAYVCENCCLMFNKSATSLLAQFNFSDLQVENPRRSSDAFTAPTGRSSPSGDKDEVADHRPSTTHSSVRPSLSRPRTTPGTMGRRDLELSPRQQSEAGVKVKFTKAALDRLYTHAPKVVAAKQNAQQARDGNASKDEQQQLAFRPHPSKKSAYALAIRDVTARGETSTQKAMTIYQRPTTTSSTPKRPQSPHRRPASPNHRPMTTNADASRYPHDMNNRHGHGAPMGTMSEADFTKPANGQTFPDLDVPEEENEIEEVVDDGDASENDRLFGDDE